MERNENIIKLFKSKSILKDKNIYINNDFIKMEMQAEYDLRQAENVFINDFEVGAGENFSFYIRNKTIWVFDKVAEVYSMRKEISN